MNASSPPPKHRQKAEACGQCGRERLSESRTAGLCEEAGCETPICKRCWRYLDRRCCSRHTLDFAERLSRAREALERGEIEILVDRSTAAVRESSYFGEVLDRLRNNPKVQVDGKTLALREKDIRQSSDDEALEGALSRLSNPEAAADSHPGGLALDAPFRKTSLMGAKRKVELRLEVISDLEKQAFPGFETEPKGEDLVRRRIEVLAGLAIAPDTERLEVLASTTGWTDGACRLARGEGDSELRSGARWALALVDLERDTLTVSPAHAAYGEILDLLRPSARLNVASEISAFLRETLVGPEFITDAALGEKFKVSPKLVLTVFQSLEATGEYQTREVEGVGWSLSRKYED